MTFRSSLSRLILSGSSCTADVGECHVVDDRIVVALFSPTDSVTITITRGTCSTSLTIGLPCTAEGYVVVKFADHGYS